eukprot:GHVU01033055.1.p1 GENE.GHVU01033055.1~~GHVU01033055.1.p1  ORF type:complete len:202 (-),score=22.85 GHVU01033055.1:151-756(-)
MLPTRQHQSTDWWLMRRRQRALQAHAVDCDVVLQLEVDGPGDMSRAVPVKEVCDALEVIVALGVLEKISSKDPEVMVKVVRECSVVTCIFIATGAMRRKGYWYGRMLVVDDLRGVSTHQYNLACGTVITGHGKAESAAIALFSSSNTQNWEMFFKFTEEAFAAAARPCKLILADDDGHTARNQESRFVWATGKMAVCVAHV